MASALWHFRFNAVGPMFCCSVWTTSEQRISKVLLFSWRAQTPVSISGEVSIVVVSISGGFYQRSSAGILSPCNEHGQEAAARCCRSILGTHEALQREVRQDRRPEPVSALQEQLGQSHWDQKDRSYLWPGRRHQPLHGGDPNRTKGTAAASDPCWA